MDKTDSFDKMDALVNGKQSYEELKRDPTPALQRKLENKLLTLKNADAFDTQRYYRLRCSTPQPSKLYGLPKLHEPGIPVRPIVSFCGSPTYQLSKYILQPQTDKSRHKVQITENFIDAIKAYRYLTTTNCRLLTWDHFTSIPLQLALQCTETAIQQSTVKLPLPTEGIMGLLNLCVTSTYFEYNGKHYVANSCRHSLGSARNKIDEPKECRSLPCCCRKNCDATRGWTCPCNLPRNDTAMVTLRWRHFYRRSQRRHWRFLRPAFCLTEQNADIQFTEEIEETGKIPFLDCLVSLDNNELRTTVQKTDAYRQITCEIILQPDFTQSHGYKDCNETSATSLWHTGQLMWRKQVPWTCFSQEHLQRWLY